MASGQDGDGGHHERMPKNMKDLLKMCITSQPEEAEGTEDGPSLQPMSKEVRGIIISLSLSPL